jgi:hypothetical protein
MTSMTISRRSWVLFAVLAVGCDSKGDDGDDPTAYCDDCNLDVQVPLVAAEGATDCGAVDIGGDPTSVSSCVEQALADGRPFVARQVLMGIDSGVQQAWVVDADGVVRLLSYDSNICGAAECDEHCGPRVSQAECANARVGAMPMDALLDCDLGTYASVCEPPE